MEHESKIEASLSQKFDLWDSLFINLIEFQIQAQLDLLLME